MGLIQWQSLQNIAAHWNTSVVRLSADSTSFLLACSSVMQFRGLWEQDDGTDVTDAQWDDIEALTAKAYTELMTDVAVGTIFPCVLSAAPSGALDCDGATHLRVDWPILYSVLDAAFIVDADHFITPDLRGRTIIGVGTGSGGGSTYAQNAQGGQETHTLTTAELAVHAHNLSDPGHNHTHSDPGHGHSVNNPTHTHGVTDPGHTHTLTDPGHTHNTAVRAGAAGIYQSGSNAGNSTTATSGSSTTGITEASATTGVSVNAAAANQTVINNTTGVTNNSATTGASVAVAGSGAAHENRQPYTALRYCIWAI